MDHLTEILLQLFAILVAAKVGNEIFRRLGQPTVVGEILGGVIAGPAVLGVYEVNAETELFAEIGVVLLLFQVGLETRLHDLLRVGRTALAVGILGVILPFAGGFLAAEMAGGDLALAIFLAAALTATSVGITSNVLRDLGALTTQSGRIILGAAVIDDVLAIMILSVASGVAAGSFAITNVLSLLVVAILFIAVVVIGGTRILRRRRSLLTDPEFAETPFLPGMIVMLGLAALASVIGLAAIIGAFLAGMVVGESSERHALEAEVAPVAAFFTPFFFGFIGAQVDIAGLANVDALVLLAGITALAVATKFVGAFIGALGQGRARAALVGWGMVPRGEVGIVVAGLGLSTGAIEGEIYSVVVGMAIITTLIVPPLLPSLVRRAEADAEPPGSAGGPAAGIEDDDGIVGEPGAEIHERTAGVRDRDEADRVAEPEPSVTPDDERRDE
ncbi:MAG TPA: cation:proton antiporter [Candidatus Binatia bacterium]|nr:cation:proton antiporter [Candidatus Binatia bacterium]